MNAEQEQSAKTRKLYDLFLFFTLSYGILVTWFFGILRPEFQLSLETFGLMTASWGAQIWAWMSAPIELMARYAYQVPDPATAEFLYGTIYVTIIAGIIAALAFGFRRFWISTGKFIVRHLANKLTVTVLLISFAVVAFFVEPAQLSAGFNLITLAILANIVCIAVQSIVKRKAFSDILANQY